MATLREYIEMVEQMHKHPEIRETAPPGAEAEDWIKANKARFKKEYGEEKGTQVLYATAWRMFGK